MKYKSTNLVILFLYFIHSEHRRSDNVQTNLQQQEVFQSKDPFSVGTQDFSSLVSNKTVGGAYNTLHDQYYENSYRSTEGNTGYFPDENSKWYNHQNKSVGALTKELEGTLPEQHQITHPATVIGGNHQTLGPSNSIAADSGSYPKTAKGQGNRWESLIQSPEHKCDTVNPAPQNFLRAVKNSIAASQHLQRYVIQ